jgi:lipopolysaccharide export system permease protein
MARMLTFDRYLLRSFWHVFVVCFIAMFGLLVVIDLLENLDDFIAKNSAAGTAHLIQSIVQYYVYQSIFFLDRAGPSLTVIAAMVVLILFQRSGELHPLLSAGVPMYRVLLPLGLAAVCISGVLVLNQELVIPRIAHAAFDSRGGSASELRVEPVYDHSTRISIDGRQLRLADRAILEAEFVLPAPGIAGDLTILKAKRAIHRAARRNRPAGWLLSEVEPPFQELQLTEQGRQVVLAGDRPDEVFVVTAVTCDQLYKRNSSYALLSTRELLRRIHSPAFGQMSVHRLIAHLHTRFTQPLVNVIAVFVALPLMVRRESPGLVIDSALCGGTMLALLGIAQAAQMAGQAMWVPADLAAWAPVFVGGGLATWLSGWMRT